MTLKQQWALVGTIVGCLGAALFLLSYSMRGELFSVGVGSNAPAFQARTLSTHEPRALADYRGKVVLLNVWATTCPPCVKEIPSLERLYREYGPRGLQLVAISVDGSPGSPFVVEDSIRRFVKNLGVTFDILRDTTGRVEEAYQTTGYPESFIIGPEGTIRRKVIGPDDWTSDGNRALFAQLLGLEMPRPARDSS